MGENFCHSVFSVCARRGMKGSVVRCGINIIVSNEQFCYIVRYFKSFHFNLNCSVWSYHLDSEFR